MEKCSKCGAAISRLISRTSFQLKGTGWYKTDYTGTNKVDGKAENGKSAAKDSGTGTPVSADNATKPKTPG